MECAVATNSHKSRVLIEIYLASSQVPGVHIAFSLVETALDVVLSELCLNLVLNLPPSAARRIIDHCHRLAGQIYPADSNLLRVLLNESSDLHFQI